MTKPHTLVAKLYKARYFPNSSFFGSKIGHNSSYTCRGIWKARQILMHGCRWCIIENGTSIKVMGEPWLRDKEGAWLPSPQVQGVHSFTINDTILNMKLWDKAKIGSLFPLNIANRIMETSLFYMVEEN
jgi:hypothetical protein